MLTFNSLGVHAASSAAPAYAAGQITRYDNAVYASAEGQRLLKLLLQQNALLVAQEHANSAASQFLTTIGILPAKVTHRILNSVFKATIPLPMARFSMHRFNQTALESILTPHAERHVGFLARLAAHVRKSPLPCNDLGQMLDMACPSWREDFVGMSGEETWMGQIHVVAMPELLELSGVISDGNAMAFDLD